MNLDLKDIDVLADLISIRIKEEYNVVESSGFCDEIDVDYVEHARVKETIKDVIVDFIVRNG